MDVLTFGIKYRNSGLKERLLLLDLIEKGDESDFIDVLIDLCSEEKDQSIKEKILLILSQFVESMDYTSIEKMFSSSDVFIRNGLIEILKNSGSKMYYYIKKFSQHQNKDIRKFAIDALSLDSSEESVNIIGNSLKDSDINIRMTAVEYLGKLDAKVYAQEIENMLINEKNMLLKCTALEALAQIGFSPKSRDIIHEFQNEKDSMFTFSFLKFLAVFGKESDFSILKAIMERSGNLFEREYIDVIGKIVRTNNLTSLPKAFVIKMQEIAKKTENSAVRYDITKILNMFQKINIVTVREKLKSSDEMEILSAIEILKEKGDALDISILEELAETTESDDLLEAIGDAVEGIYKRINL